MTSEIHITEPKSDCHLKLEYLTQFAVGDVFCETGTYKGEAVRVALTHGFEHIETIELNKELYDAAVEMFKDEPRVTVHFGDSVEIMPLIMDKYPDKEMTFWLDAHASGPLAGGKTGPCPLVEELRVISGRNLEVLRMNPATMTLQAVSVPRQVRTHTIFIDDRRLLGTAEWGGVTEHEVLRELALVNESYNVHALDGHVPGDVLVATMRE